MKRLIFLALFSITLVGVVAQTRLKMRIWKDGHSSSYILNEIDSILFQDEVFIPNVESTKNATTIVWNTVDFSPCIHPDQQLVLAGNYNNWNTYPVDMIHFEPIYGLDGWWKAVVTPKQDTSILTAIPCAIATDGTFSWDYQWANTKAGDCEVISGDAVIKTDTDNNLQLQINSNSSIVYIRSYGFRKDPCNSDSFACEEAVQEARKILSDSATTWEMAYFPNLESSLKGYNMVINFNQNGSVCVSAKNSTTTGNELMTDCESTWVVKRDYGPLLSFDTYNNVFHAFSDPREDGAGLMGDYEFYILKATTDVVLLKGKKHGAYCVMRPMRNTDVEDYFSTCEKMQTTLFGNNNLVTYNQNDKKKYLYNGSSGQFQSAEYGGKLVAEDATYHPICVTEDGIIVSVGIGDDDQERIFTYDSIKGELKGESGSIINAGNLNVLFDSYFADNSFGWSVDTTGVDSVAAFLEQVNTLVKDSKKSSKIKVMGYGYKQSLNMYEGGYFILVQVGYKQNGKGKEQVVKLLWTIDMTINENGLEVSNLVPYNTTTEKWIENIPAVQGIVESLVGTFSAEPGDNLFNAAAGMKLVNTDKTLLIKGATDIKM